MTKMMIKCPLCGKGGSFGYFGKPDHTGVMAGVMAGVMHRMVNLNSSEFVQ